MQIGTRQKLNQVKFISHKVVRAFGEYDIGACAALRVKTLCMWFDNKLLRATKGARYPNLQFVTTHASHVCSQHSFGLPLRMFGIHIT